MFLAFDPFTLLLLIALCFFLPGILISFAVLRNVDLNIVEKAFVGMGIGFVVPPAIPFLAYFFFGIKYTYELALITIGLFWLVAVVLAVWKRADREITELAGRIKSINWYNAGLMLGVIFLALLAFWIRFGSYSPVFQELDPYYYTYIAQQIITDGHNPVADGTAWYPEITVSHRAVPELAYMEALWYSIYNGSNDYNNMLLAVIASMYPPIAAMLSVFFFYLFLSRIMKKEYALIGSGLASFAPTVIFKLMAGEQEVQPYAFFALPFFYALYLLMLQERKHVFAVLSGIAYFALALGCSSEILAITTLIIFWVLYGLFIFLKNAKSEEIKKLIELNTICLGIGILFGSILLKGLFYSGTFELSGLLPLLFIFVILGALYFVRLVPWPKSIDRKVAVAVLAVVMFIVLLSPLGEPVKQLGRTGFMAAQYTTPLLRTIAEQGTAGVDLSGSMGFVALSYNGIIYDFFAPLFSVISSAEAQQSLSSFIEFLGNIVSFIFIPFWFITNLFSEIAVGLINFILGSNVQYEWKTNTLLLVWPIFMLLAAVYWIYRNRKAEHSYLAPVLFLLIAVLPPFLVGIIKAKYTIYAAFFLGAGIAFALNETDVLLGRRLKVLKNAALVVGFFLLFMQFVHGGLAPSLAIINLQPRFQDNPSTLQEKFQIICDDTHDSKICSAARDPVAYANKGTIYQYDREFCMISSLPDYGVYINPDKSPSLYQATLLRCNRIDTYWIESMEWIRYNTEKDSRTTSWWDYGHWINFFGQKNTVLRNEHASQEMIGSVAYSYIDGSPEELIRFMRYYDSEYALFDGELVASGGGFGGKYGALNYLSCAYMNETSVDYSPGESDCEAEHLWEIVYMSPTDLCTISKVSGQTGAVAYTIKIGPPNGEWTYTPYYPGVCVGEVTSPNMITFCRSYVHLVPTYCVGNIELANGQMTTGTFYLNETYPNGDLKLNKGIIAYPFGVMNTYHFGENQLTGFTMVYTKDRIWMENGEIVDGYEDRKGKFYDSNLYKGFILGEIEGFDKVYETSDGAVKIYKISE